MDFSQKNLYTLLVVIYIYIYNDRGVGFVKLSAHCVLIEGDVEHAQRLKGICFLKGDTVAVLVALHCEDGTVHSLLVEQPRCVFAALFPYFCVSDFPNLPTCDGTPHHTTIELPLVKFPHWNFQPEC